MLFWKPPYFPKYNGSSNIWEENTFQHRQTIIFLFYITKPVFDFRVKINHERNTSFSLFSYLINISIKCIVAILKQKT